jgi:serine/threonine protein kinase
MHCPKREVVGTAGRGGLAVVGWHDSERLKPREADQLQVLVAELRQSWRDGRPVPLGQLVRGVNAVLRPPFLFELIQADLELSFRHRAPRHLDFYLREFPEIGPAAALPVDLIVAEYHLRHVHGDAPALTTYQARFPAQFALLQERIGQQGLGTLQVPGDRPTVPPDRLTTPVPSPPLTPAGRSSVTRTDAREAIPPLPSQPPSSGSARRAHDHAGMGYTLVDRLGSGAFGEVWRALAPGEIPVAVKRLHRPVEDMVSKREEQSLEVMKALRHTYLLQTQAYWIQDERLHIAMELADGSLADWFKGCREQGMTGIPFEPLLAYFREAAEALDFLHQQGRIHRDIKPANLLHLHGHAKIADFGLARLFENDEATGTFCGTPQYMAPEMWRSHASPRSDQYCLAVAFVELITGRPPYAGKNQFTLEAQHTAGKPDLDGFSPAERHVLLRALAKNPEQRYPTCVAFVEALAEAHARKPEAERRPFSLPRLLHATFKMATLTTAALMLIVAGVVIANKFIRPPERNKPDTNLPTLPEGFEPAKDAQVIDGKYDRIVFTRLKGVAPIEFVLIRQEGPRDPPTFYIMRDKVTCEQFQAALEQLGLKAELDRQAGRFPGAIRREWEQKVFPIADNAKRPLMYVTPVEAHCFAELLGGKLPSERQWDKAGGRWDTNPWGPCKKGAVRSEQSKQRKKPDPDGTDEADVSGHGCRGMAGNGREWTRNIDERSDVEIPLDRYDPRNKPKIILRGQAPWSEHYFKFAWIDKGEDELERYPQWREYDHPGPDIGFRVVLERLP